MRKRITRSLVLLLLFATASMIDLLVALQRLITDVGLRILGLVVTLIIAWLVRDPSYPPASEDVVLPLRIRIGFSIAEWDVITDLAAPVEHRGGPRLRELLVEQLKQAR
jgi:hypothetical protein